MKFTSKGLLGAVWHGQEQEKGGSGVPRLRRNGRFELHPSPQAGWRETQAQEVFASAAEAHVAHGKEEVASCRNALRGVPYLISAFASAVRHRGRAQQRW